MSMTHLRKHLKNVFVLISKRSRLTSTWQNLCLSKSHRITFGFITERLAPHPAHSHTRDGLVNLSNVLILGCSLLSNTGYGLFTFAAGNGWGIIPLFWWLSHWWHVPSHFQHDRTSLRYGAQLRAKVIPASICQFFLGQCTHLVVADCEPYAQVGESSFQQ